MSLADVADAAPTFHIDALAMRRCLGRDEWEPPVRYGPAGWLIDRHDGAARIIVSCAPMFDDGVDWRHASISRPDRIPDYQDLVSLHRAAFGHDAWAYQVFAPSRSHINIHAHALHLWGHCDRTPALPDFGAAGTI